MGQAKARGSYEDRKNNPNVTKFSTKHNKRQDAVDEMEREAELKNRREMTGTKIDLSKLTYNPPSKPLKHRC